MTQATELTVRLLQAMPLPRPDAGQDKDGRGRILGVAGGRRVPGAAVLCGLAAMRAGAGKLQMASIPAYAGLLGFALPEAMIVEAKETSDGELSASPTEELSRLAREADAIVIGPGMLDESAAARLACALMEDAPDARLVIDAAALTGLARCQEAEDRCRGRVVLTPHPGEMASLMETSIDEVQAAPMSFALQAAKRFDAVVALKQRDTHVCDPEGRAWVNRGGSVGLATSGSGDVLAGLIGGLLARGAPPAEAALWGVFLHARSGARLSEKMGAVGFLAREIIDPIPGLLDEFSG